MQIKNVQAIADKSKKHKVEQISEKVFKVRSVSKKLYYVRTASDTATCGCKWGEYNPNSACSHVLAVHSFVEAQSSRTVKAHASAVDVSKQKRRTIHTGNGVTLVARKV
jgi:hypothetical protein